VNITGRLSDYGYEREVMIMFAGHGFFNTLFDSDPYKDIKGKPGYHLVLFFDLIVLGTLGLIGFIVLCGLLYVGVSKLINDSNAGTLSMFFIASYLYWAWGADRRRREKLAAKRDADNSN
jgi:hypothetical protein